MDSSLRRLPGESELKWIYRIGELKDAGIIDMTWAELAEIFNKELREPDEEWTESSYRKKYNLMRQFHEEFDSQITNSAEAEELIELRRELEKEKVKIRDERNEYRRIIREEARKESYKEQFIRAISEAASEHALEYVPSVEDMPFMDHCTAVIMLSDLHCGIDIENSWNTYNEKVLRQRMGQYLAKITEIQHRHHCESAVVIISEVISGLIHTNLRIQNNMDLIDQFLTATGYITDFLVELSRMFETVSVYVAPGNHSRINAKKDQDLTHENMDNLIIPFLQAKLQNYDNIGFYANEIEQTIAVFPIYKWNCVAVHGDRDNFNNASANLSKFLDMRVHYCFCGHKHTNELHTDGDMKTIQCGCLSGSDEFALNNRLRNRPEQVVCIITEKSGLDCIYDIKF